MTRAEKIKKLCQDKGITVKKLENDLGYGNGALMKKAGAGIKHERLKEISAYFHIDVNYFYEDFSFESTAASVFKAFNNQFNSMARASISDEELEVALAYSEAPEAIKEAVAKLLDVKRASQSSKEA